MRHTAMILTLGFGLSAVYTAGAEVMMPSSASLGGGPPGALGAKQVIDIKAKSLVGPSVKVDEQGIVHLAWMEERGDARSILFARSPQAGQPVGPAVVVNRPQESPYWRQEAPALDTSGDTIFISWAMTHPRATPEKPFSSELRLSRSVDGGRTFEPSVLINDDDSVANHSFDGLHAAPDGHVYLSWIDPRDGKKDPATYAAYSADGGKTITKNVKIDEDTCVCCRTSIARGPDGTLYVAWRKILNGDVRETVVARSTDGGHTWSQPVIVGHDEWRYQGCPHRPASIEVDARNRVYVVWYTEGNDETPAIYLAYSDDGARTFSTKRQLNRSKGTFPDHPHMAVDPAGRVVVVWEEQSPVRREVVMSCSLDRGDTFSTPQKLNEKKGQAPSVSINAGGLVAMAWTEHAMPGHKIVVQTAQLPSLLTASSGVERMR